MYLLDTDTLIYSLKGHKNVVENFRIYADAPKAISVISYGELVFGAEKSVQIAQNLAKVHRLREVFPVIDLKIGRACVGKECRSRWSPYH